MGDENIKAILELAARDPAFLQALLRNREVALQGMALKPRERVMLLSVPDDQLKRMVKQARTRTLLQSPIVKLGCATAVAAAALSAVVIPFGIRGIRPDVTEETAAASILSMVGEAERKYKLEHGQYGSLEDLRKLHPPWLDYLETGKYTIKVIVQGDTFTASALHKERPQTRSRLVLVSEGTVEVLPPETGLKTGK